MKRRNSNPRRAIPGPRHGNAGYIPRRTRRVFGPKSTEGGPIARAIHRMSHVNPLTGRSEADDAREILAARNLERKKARHPKETHFV